MAGHICKQTCSTRWLCHAGSTGILPPDRPMLDRLVIGYASVAESPSNLQLDVKCGKMVRGRHQAGIIVRTAFFGVVLLWQSPLAFSCVSLFVLQRRKKERKKPVSYLSATHMHPESKAAHSDGPLLSVIDSLFSSCGRQPGTHSSPATVSSVPPTSPYPLSTLRSSSSSSSSPQSLRGSCFCGTISFSVTGHPVHCIFCHCSSCQRITGAPCGFWCMWRRDLVDVRAEGREQIVDIDKDQRLVGYKTSGRPSRSESVY